MGRHGSISPTRSLSPRLVKRDRVKREIHSSDAEGGEDADAESVKGIKKERVYDAPTAGIKGTKTGKMKHPPMTSWSKEERQLKLVRNATSVAKTRVARRKLSKLARGILHNKKNWEWTAQS